MLAAIGLVGLVDWATGPHIGLSLFYLAPVTWSGWALGRRMAVISAMSAAAVWFLAEVAWPHDYPLAISIWNAVTRTVIFVALGVLLARVRADRHRLEEANAVLQARAVRESLLARTDPTTGLANRRAFSEALAAELAHVSRSGDSLGVAYVDLDGFKQINDNAGHAAGDEALARVAASLRQLIRASDTVARIGGDEFAVLLRGASASDAAKLGDRIVRGISRLRVGSSATALGASVGVAIAGAHPTDAHGLLLRADRAMYVAKLAGGRRVHVSPGKPEPMQEVGS